MLNQIFKNLFSMAIAKILAQVFAFFTTVYISRTIGVENFGKIGFVTAIVIYFDMFSTLGLEPYSIREISRHENRLSFFIGSTISLRLFASFILFLVLLVINFVWDETVEIRHLLLLYGLSLFVKTFSLNWTFAALRRMEFYGLTQIILQFVYMLCTFILVKTYKDIYYIPIAFIIGHITCVLYTWFMHRRIVKSISFVINLTVWKRMLKISLPMILSYIIGRIYLSFSIIYIGFIGDKSEVGLYNAAFKIIFLLIAIREILVSVVYPLLSKYYIESKEKLKKIMQGFIKIAILFALPVTTGGILLSSEIISTIFGIQYIDAHKPLQILLISYLLLMINIVYPSTQNAFNKQNIYFRVSLINCVSNIIFNIICISIWGIIGAAIATVLTDAVSLILFRNKAKKIIFVPFLGIFLKILFPTTLMVLVLILLPDIHVIQKILIGIVVYIIGVFTFKTFTEEEYKIIRSLRLARNA